jgi:hypothetical protein
MRKFSFLGIILLGLISLTKGYNIDIQNFNCYSSEGDTSHVAILKFDKSFYWIFKNVKPAFLTVKEVGLIGKLLEAAIGEHNQKIKNNNFSIRPLANYKMQFVPAINIKGEKEVWVNCFCEADQNWRNEIVIVEDGGNCFFNLKINLTNKTYSRISVNGYA